MYVRIQVWDIYEVKCFQALIVKVVSFQNKDKDLYVHTRFFGSSLFISSIDFSLEKERFRFRTPSPKTHKFLKRIITFTFVVSSQKRFLFFISCTTHFNRTGAICADTTTRGSSSLSSSKEWRVESLQNKKSSKSSRIPSALSFIYGALYVNQVPSTSKAREKSINQWFK